MKPVYTETCGPFTLEIFQDECPSDPTEDMDFLSHRFDTRYNLESLSGRDLIAEIGNSLYSQVPTQSRGYVYMVCPKANWKKEFKTRKEAQKCIDGEADILRMYFEGEIYEYVLTCNGETVDSLCGMYGYEYALQEGKSALIRAHGIEQEAKAFVAESFAL